MVQKFEKNSNVSKFFASPLTQIVTGAVSNGIAKEVKDENN